MLPKTTLEPLRTFSKPLNQLITIVTVEFMTYLTLELKSKMPLRIDKTKSLKLTEKLMIYFQVLEIWPILETISSQGETKLKTLDHLTLLNLTTLLAKIKTVLQAEIKSKDNLIALTLKLMESITVLEKLKMMLLQPQVLLILSINKSQSLMEKLMIWEGN